MFRAHTALIYIYMYIFPSMKNLLIFQSFVQLPESDNPETTHRPISINTPLTNSPEATAEVNPHLQPAAANSPSRPAAVNPPSRPPGVSAPSFPSHNTPSQRSPPLSLPPPYERCGMGVSRWSFKKVFLVVGTKALNLEISVYFFCRNFFSKQNYKEAGGFSWTPVKWRRPFTLGAAILEFNELFLWVELNSKSNCENCQLSVLGMFIKKKSSSLPNNSSFFMYKLEIYKYLLFLFANILLSDSYVLFHHLWRGVPPIFQNIEHFFRYSRFHKTIPKCSLKMQWISARFIEMGVRRRWRRLQFL